MSEWNVGCELDKLFEVNGAGFKILFYAGNWNFGFG